MNYRYQTNNTTIKIITLSPRQTLHLKQGMQINRVIIAELLAKDHHTEQVGNTKLTQNTHDKKKFQYGRHYYYLDFSKKNSSAQRQSKTSTPTKNGDTKLATNATQAPALWTTLSSATNAHK